MLSRLRPARLTSMLLLRKALLCRLRPSDIPSVWMRQCKANRPVILPFRENDSLPGDDTSNGPFGLLKKSKQNPQAGTQDRVSETPLDGTQVDRRKISPPRTAHTSRLKQHYPLPMLRAKLILQAPIEPLPACSGIISHLPACLSTHRPPRARAQNNRTIKKEKRQRNKFCAL